MPEVEFGRFLFAGLAAGYVRTLTGYWMEGVWGLSKIDLAQGGKKYLEGDMGGHRGGALSTASSCGSSSPAS